jgi:hypothetical protein
MRRTNQPYMYIPPEYCMNDKEFEDFYYACHYIPEDNRHWQNPPRPVVTYNFPPDTWQREVDELERRMRQSPNVPNSYISLWLLDIDRARRDQYPPLPRVILRELLTRYVSRDPDERNKLFSWFNLEIASRWGQVEPIIRW